MAQQGASPLKLALLGLLGAGAVVVWEVYRDDVKHALPPPPPPPVIRASAPAAPAWARGAKLEPPAGVPRRPPTPITVVRPGSRNPTAVGHGVHAPPEPPAAKDPEVPKVLRPKYEGHPGWIAGSLGDSIELAGDACIEIWMPPGRYGGFWARVDSFHRIHDRLGEVSLRPFVALVGSGDVQSASWREVPAVPLGQAALRFSTREPFDRLRFILSSHRAAISLSCMVLLDFEPPKGELAPLEVPLTVAAVDARSVTLAVPDGARVAVPLELVSDGPPEPGVRIAGAEGPGICHRGADGWMHWDRDPAWGGNQMYSLEQAASMGTDLKQHGEPAAWLRGRGMWSLLASDERGDSVEELYDGELGALAVLERSGKVDLSVGGQGRSLWNPKDVAAALAGLTGPPASHQDSTSKSIAELIAKDPRGAEIAAFVRRSLTAFQRRLSEPVPLAVGETLVLAQQCRHGGLTGPWFVPLELVESPEGPKLHGQSGAATFPPGSLGDLPRRLMGQGVGLFRPKLPHPIIKP